MGFFIFIFMQTGYLQQTFTQAQSGVELHIICRQTPRPCSSDCRTVVLLSDDSENNKRVLDDTVVLHNAMEEDSGVYQCEASNRHGRILANINILVMSEYCVTKSAI